MSYSTVIQILILAAVALLVFARLYSVLGQRRGSERPAEPRPAAVEAGPTAPTQPRQTPVLVNGPGGQGIAAIMQADPSFDAGHFLSGARAAYEMIVQAFSQGDKESLRTLLTPRVFASYSSTIDQRQAQGGKGPELVRLRSAEIADASLEGTLSRIWVKFEAELAEGDHGLRDTKERWTFERDIRSRDPSWMLAGVAQA